MLPLLPKTPGQLLTGPIFTLSQINSPQSKIKVIPFDAIAVVYGQTTNKVSKLASEASKTLDRWSKRVKFVETVINKVKSNQCPSAIVKQEEVFLLLLLPMDQLCNCQCDLAFWTKFFRA